MAKKFPDQKVAFLREREMNFFRNSPHYPNTNTISQRINHKSLRLYDEAFLKLAVCSGQVGASPSWPWTCGGSHFRWGLDERRGRRESTQGRGFGHVAKHQFVFPANSSDCQRAAELVPTGFPRRERLRPPHGNPSRRSHLNGPENTTTFGECCGSGTWMWRCRLCNRTIYTFIWYKTILFERWFFDKIVSLICKALY